MKRIVFMIVLMIILLSSFQVYDKKKKDSQEVAENIAIEKILVEEKLKEEKHVYQPYFFEGKWIHAVVSNDTNIYETVEKNTILKKINRGDNINIISESGELYEIQYNNVHGFIEKAHAQYFIFHGEKRYTLGSDVSSFNYGRDFANSGEFALYLLEHDFNYVIIRMRW